VKAGIETRYLRHVRQAPADSFDRCKIVGLMQWSERLEPMQLGKDLTRDQRRTGEGLAAVYDAMADTEHLSAAVPDPEPSRKEIERASLIAHIGIQLVVDQNAARVVPC
jgi:hypothetical protein